MTELGFEPGLSDSRGPVHDDNSAMEKLTCLNYQYVNGIHLLINDDLIH